MTEINITNENKNKQENQKKKFKFKMPSALTIIIGVVVFAAILTWIPHGGDGHGGSYSEWQSAILDDAVTSYYQSYMNSGWYISVNGSIVWDYSAIQSASDFWNIAASGNTIIFSPSGEEFKLFQTYDQALASVGGDASSIGSNFIYADDLINNVAGTYGLEGSWDSSAGVFVTFTDLPWTLSAFEDGTNSRFGLLDTFYAMVGGYSNAFGVALYLVGIYAVVLMLEQTETLHAGVSSLVKGLNGKEIILLPTLFFLFALGGTLFGMQEETLGLLPIIVPVIILAGFDAPAGMMVAVLGTTTGIAASVLDPFSVGVMAAGLGEGIGTGILPRLILFLIYTSIGMAFVTWYGLRVRKDKKKSADVEAIESNEVWAAETIGDINDLESMSKKQKWAISIFGIVFAWMVFALMPWTTWFPALAEDGSAWVVFSSIFFGNVLIGEWYFVQLSILFFVAVIILAMIFNYSTKQTLNVFWTSLKDMFGVITIIAFSRATSMILTSSGLTYGMIYGMTDPEALGDVSPLIFMLTWLPIFLVMGLFIPSTSGLAGVTAPIIGGVVQAVEQSGTSSPEHTTLMIVGILMIYPLAQGVVNMFSPTTGLVVVQAETSKVNYGKILPWLVGYAATILVVGIVATSGIMMVLSSMNDLPIV